MNENITNDKGKDGDTIFYKTITQEIIDQNTKKCVRYPESEFVLDSNGKKQCVGKVKQENGKDKIGTDGEVECADNQGYKKHKDYDKNKAGQCKTQDIQLYTTGVTFTPNYDESKIDSNNQYCKAGETQSFEAIEEKTYKFPESEIESLNEAQKGNESSYYKFIQKHKNNAMDISNYQKSITKVLCTADNEKSNMNAYIIGAIMNLYHSTKLTKLEIESLKDMSMSLQQQDLSDYEWRNKVKVEKRWKLGRKEWLLFNFSTKDNWANNQTIYEHEMYRPFRRPDGSTFYLYERQGFFSNEPKIDCADCARDDELNG